MSERETVAQVEELFRRWLVEAVAANAAFFEEHLAEEFRYVNAGGVEFTKAELIEVNTLVEDNSYSLLSFGGRVYGDIVLAHGEYHAKGHIPQGTAPQGVIDFYRDGVRLRITTIWRLTPDGLRALLLHSTPILS